MADSEVSSGPTYADRKAEVRQRLEQQARKSKKGFMTPERKKKLRGLLVKHAQRAIAEKTRIKAEERRKVVEQRCGKPKDLNGLSDDQLREVCKEYHERIKKIESEKWDMERAVESKDYVVDEMNIAVNNLRGKFVKPTLKKVSKYENKFAKLQKKAAEYNFRQNLKVVKKKEFSMSEEDSERKVKPEWTKGEKSKSISSEAPPEMSSPAKEVTSSSASSSDAEE